MFNITFQYYDKMYVLWKLWIQHMLKFSIYVENALKFAMMWQNQCMCHGLLDDRPTDDHSSGCRPLSTLRCVAWMQPSVPLGSWPHSNWPFPPNSHTYHQMWLVVMSHPMAPCLDLSQSLGRHQSRWNVLKTSTTPLDFMACHLVSVWVHL